MKKNTPSKTQEDDQDDKMRIDKWLWSARFFRTRMLAKKAIENGKVHMGGQRVKTSREVHIGDVLTVRQGSATSSGAKDVVIKSLSAQRGNASLAESMYEETVESSQRRDVYQEQRNLANLARPDTKPNKQDRRKIKDFKSNY